MTLNRVERATKLEEQAIAKLYEDKSHEIWLRDYGHRNQGEGVGFFRGTINALIISALIYVPIFIYFWRTK